MDRDIRNIVPIISGKTLGKERAINDTPCLIGESVIIQPLVGEHAA